MWNETREPVGKGKEKTVAFLFVYLCDRTVDVLRNTGVISITFVVPEVMGGGLSFEDRWAALGQNPMNVLIEVWVNKGIDTI